MNQTRECQVGDTFSLHSENYGLVAYITVAKVNLLHPGDVLAFMDGYTHPSKAFSAYSIGSNPDCYKNPDDKSSQFAYFVSIPLDIANQYWWDKNPDCGYRKKVKRKPRRTTPPSHVSFKEFQKWLGKSLTGLETYLTLDQVKTAASKIDKMDQSELRKICINPRQT
jgi:hypothetical protein